MGKTAKLLRRIHNGVRKRLGFTPPPPPPYGPDWLRIQDGGAADVIAILERSSPIDLEYYFVLGAAYHAQGDMSRAVAIWAAGADKQAELILAAGLPWKLRYLGPLWTNSIGHMALLDILAKQRLLGLAEHDYVVVYDPETVGNDTYLDRWRPYFDIRKKPLITLDRLRPYFDIRKKPFITLDRLRPYFDIRKKPLKTLAEVTPTVIRHRGRWRWIHDAASDIEREWQAQRRDSLLRLSESDKKRARRALGLPRDAWFVTMHIREGGESRRNATVAEYIPAIEHITNEGGYVVRIGNPSMSRLPSFSRLIDLAHLPRRDWLDLYAIAAGRFFIGTNSGPAWVAGTFRVPCLLTNWAPVGISPHYPDTIILPQRLWSRSQNRYIDDAEQLSGPLAFAENPTVLNHLGIEVVSNTAEELCAATARMLTLTAQTTR